MNLSSTQWRRAKDILADALELDEAARDAFVARQCEGAPALLAEVRSLLGHADGLTSFGATSPQLPGAASVDAAPRQFSGLRAGPYRLTESIGQGGMGVVYAAERADGAYRQTVAVKLLKGNFSSELDARRMARERQALAALDHPNIARLLDGGTSEEGIPYLVMELVEGIPIDDYCKAMQLSIAARIGLMVSVCGAVQAAHQQLLIHRDIKPCNILVNAQGVPKLLDFGVARLMESDGGAAATQDAALLFTPRYASPEQIRGLPVSVATDVHGLGLLMYELLAGSSPYERLSNATTASAGEAIRAILEDTPKKASQIALATAPASVAQLNGELDTILLKACAKDAAARYATVAELAADLQRWLDGKPIQARPQAWHYVARKFAGRHRVGTLLGALALIGIAAGVAGTIVQKNEAVRQQGIAVERAAQVRQFANSMIFNYYDAIENLTGSLSVRKKLVQDALRYLDSLEAGVSDDPALAVELASGYSRLANILYNGVNLPSLGDQGGAAKARAKAMELLDRVLARDPDNKDANAAWALATSDEAALLGADGKTKEAIAMMQASAERYARIVRLDPADSQAHYELIKIHVRSAQAALNGNQPSRSYLDQAEKQFRIWAARNARDPELQNMHAFLLRTQQREAALVKDMPRVFSVIEQELGVLDQILAREPDNDTIQAHKSSALNAYAVYKYQQGEPDAALGRLLESMALVKKMAERDPRDTLNAGRLARSYVHLGNIKLLQNDKAAALEAYRASAAAYDALMRAADHQAGTYRFAGEAYHKLAQMLAAQGQAAEARAAAQKLLAMARRSPAPFAAGAPAEWVALARKTAGLD